MNHIIIHSATGKQEATAEADEPILRALESAGGLVPDSPCGGKGLCGKCRIRIISGPVSAPEGRELEILSAAERTAGIRLSCIARALGDVEIELAQEGAAAIVSDRLDLDAAIDPPVRKVAVNPAAGMLTDQQDDERRFLRAVESAVAHDGPLSLDFSVLTRLPGILRGTAPGEAGPAGTRPAGSPPTVTAIVAGNRVVGIEGGDTSRHQYGVGIDIGTTTVVCYLLDLVTGTTLAVRSGMNAQRPFGADVISRIQYTKEHPAGLADLHRRIAEQLTGLIAAAAAEARIGPEGIIVVAIAGNSTMLHLLAGVSPAAIAEAPFIPAFTDGRMVRAAEIGISVNGSCTAILLPGVSGYVGADIVAGMTAVRMAEKDKNILFIDIGTNGEMAFGNARGILCCSTAAGPAFEGAVMEKGSAGVAGAIDSVWLADGRISYTTIGRKPPTGLCGSGIIDALAVFLECGLVDETGRIIDGDEAAALSPELAALREEGRAGAPGGPRLYIDRASGMYLSQADIREAQLAKAAIAAGIDILVRESGKTLADIDRAYLAGGFGSYIDTASAVRIGLLPAEIRDRIVVAGNTSGSGAVAACLSAERLASCDKVRFLSRYVELSASADFNDAYIERMMFPEYA